MEHRWGRRIAVDIPIQIATAGAAQAGAQLANLSFTGTLIKAEFLLRIRCRILIALKRPYRLEGELSHIAALVTHNHAQGIGVEWCEMGSATVIQLLRAPRHRCLLRRAASARERRWWHHRPCTYQRTVLRSPRTAALAGSAPNKVSAGRSGLAKPH